MAGMALELDTIDDPRKALWEAVAGGDVERALGAWRLLEAGGQKPDLEPQLARELAELLEGRGHYLDAARVFRMAAEADLAAPEAAGSVLRAAALLLGPAGRPEPGLALLDFFLERWPAHPEHPRAAGIRARLSQGESVPSSELLPHLEASLVEVHRPACEAAAAEHRAAPLEALQDFGGAGALARLGLALNARLGPVGSPRWRWISRLYAGALLLTLVALAAAWGRRDDYKTVTELHPEVLREPRQVAVERPVPFSFEYSGYRFDVTPLADYDLAGLVVAKRDHTSFWTEDEAEDDAFPADLCVLWGPNLTSGAYSHPSAEFEIHGRVCYTQSCGLPILGTALSNNHIFLRDGSLQDRLDEILPGDQIRVRGQLVAIHARLLGSAGMFDKRRFEWVSSTTRDDVAMGACETILTSQLDILRPGHPLAAGVTELAAWLALALLALGAARFVLLPVRVRDVRRAAQG